MLTPDQLALIVNAPEFLTCYGWAVKPYTAQRWFSMLGSISFPDPVVFSRGGVICIFSLIVAASINMNPVVAWQFSTQR